MRNCSMETVVGGGLMFKADSNELALTPPNVQHAISHAKMHRTTFNYLNPLYKMNSIYKK